MLCELVSPLLQWYDRVARDLPWRRTRDPYAIWLSEIMCQQTRVQTAIDYYHRFLAALPTVRDLAEVEEDRLMKLWEGLGYYSRARNLQKAAQVICRDHEGQVPDSFEGLRSLPGIGDYTAGAIGSIAFGLRVPCVDGNVLRVITRVTCDERPIDRGTTRADITQAVAAIVPTDRPGDFNQALMELGATVCLPNGEPLCGECPLAFLCRGREKGVALSLPRKAPKKERKIQRRTVFLLFWEDKVALRKRPDSGLLAGMWEFPSVEGTLSSQEGLAHISTLGLAATDLQSTPKAKHIFSHVEWQMSGWEGAVVPTDASSDLVWFTRHQLEQEAALASAYKVYTHYAMEKLGD